MSKRAPHEYPLQCIQTTTNANNSFRVNNIVVFALFEPCYDLTVRVRLAFD